MSCRLLSRFCGRTVLRQDLRLTLTVPLPWLQQKVYDNLSIVTRSHPSAFPSVLQQKRQLVSALNSAGEASEREKAATINEKCPKCGHDEMQFHTLQLRSADEGSTVFYDCPKCGHSWSQNN